MSRVGKQPIPLPEDVKVGIEGGLVRVEGPLGRLEHRLPEGIRCEMDEGAKCLLVRRASDSKAHKMLHGLSRTLIHNMVVGVKQGYRKELEIVGIGYNVRIERNAVVLQVGFANSVRLPIPEGLKAEVIQAANPGRLAVTGCDKQQVGQFAARIRSVRPPEPYQGKGIRYVGEVIRRKAGKAFVGAGA